jgi:hypothetical protein
MIKKGKIYMKKILFTLIALIVFSNTAIASDFKESGYYDYEGTIGKNTNIVMSLFIDKNKVDGSYFYDKVRKEINIKGTINGDNITLNEYGQDNSATAAFNGKVDKDNNISGKWISKTKEAQNFNIKLVSILTYATLGHRYMQVWDNDKEVENFVQELQGYIKTDNKARIAELIRYPINVNINSKRVQIKDKNEFIKNYSSIFNKSFKDIMSNSYTKYMFSNYQGVMFGGNGKNMWINAVAGKGNKAKLSIIAINN